MLMKKISFASCFMVLLVLCCIIYTPTYANTASNNEAELNRYFEESFKQANYTNAAVVMVSKDKTLYQYGYGKVDTFDEQFIIGSSTKSFTALAIMGLVEDGKISLDAPIDTYLSDTWVPKSLAEQVTVRQLLNQTSGIHQYHIKDIGTIEKPGEVYYSNANFDLLGLIIEQVSKQSYGEYMQTAIFQPMGMANTTAKDDENPSLHLIGGSKTYFGFNVSARQHWSLDAVPSGYIASTPKDMAAYLKMYLNDGVGQNSQLVTTETLNQMFTQTVAITGNSPIANIVEDGSYGFGWFVGKKNGVEVFSHGGNVETYSTAMTILPEQGVGIIIQVSSDDYLTSQAVLGEIEKGALSYLASGVVPPTVKLEYWRTHAFINLALAVLMGVCVFMLLRLKRWRSQPSSRQGWSMILSLVVPSAVFILLPMALRVPYDIIWGFATDIAFVLFLTLICACAIGLYKACYMLVQKVRRQ